MPGMKDDYEYDAEGDVKMAVPQPIFEVTRAPSLKGWGQSAITTFLRERKQYEGKLIERCHVPHVAHYILKEDVASVSDDMQVAEMIRKVDTMMNGRIPDVKQLFARELKLDLSEVEVEARIAIYFMKVDRLAEDNGLAGMLGRGVAVDEQGRQRMK
ncbi:hypothetical protein PI124_g16274 [Phytophthora idaei]|nr:hypothetical protein PI124_g16274 [Phytophthora idaei]